MDSPVLRLPQAAYELYQVSDWGPELREILPRLVEFHDEEVVEYFLEGLVLELEAKGSVVGREIPAATEELVGYITDHASPSDVMVFWEIARLRIPAQRKASLADVIGDAKEWSDELEEQVEYWLDLHGEWGYVARVAARAKHPEALQPRAGRQPGVDEVVGALIRHLTPAELVQAWGDEDHSIPQPTQTRTGPNPRVIDDEMLALAVRLRNEDGLSWEAISRRLVIKNGPRTGQHPTLAGLLFAVKARVPSEVDPQTGRVRRQLVVDDEMQALALKLRRVDGLTWEQIRQRLVIKVGPRAGQHPSIGAIFEAVNYRAR